MSEPDPNESDGLFEEAAAWFARMRGPDAEASRPAFEAWLSRGALHRAAYNRASEIFAMGKHLADDSDDRMPPAAGRRRESRLLIIAACAAAVVVVLGSAWLVARLAPFGKPGAPSTEASSTPTQMAQVTAGREAQSIRLSDGSVVNLRAGTGIAVDFGKAMRRLRLERGSARFFVAHEVRPFVVYAGGGTVTAHGTIFDVALAAKGQVFVRLIRGAIEVTPPPMGIGGRNPASRQLHSGESMNFTAATAAVHAEPAREPAGSNAGTPAPAAFDTKDFDSVPLAELIRLANASGPRPIRLGDPALARLRISGRFRIDDTNLLAARIAALFGLVADARDPTQIVLRAK